MKQLNLLSGLKQIRVALVLSILCLLSISKESQAQDGTSMYDAIHAGYFSSSGGGPYYDSRNTSYYNGTFYYDNYYFNNGQPSTDVWYYIQIDDYANLRFSLCGSYFDTYLHLLDEYGNEITSNDDSYECGSQSFIEYNSLPSGNYYVVIEGSGFDSGDFYFEIQSTGGCNSSPSAGANMSNAISAGTFSASGSYTDTRSNIDACLGNDIGQTSNDIYYQFTLNGTATVSLSHCGSATDTYMWLLDAWGNVITYNDDNSSSSTPCPGLESYIETSLTAGTYYLVSETYGSGGGTIVTNIDVIMSGGGSSCTGSPLNASISQDQNYIVTYSPREPISNASQFANAAVCQVQQTVQYFDGLGRPLQTVQTKASPTEKDIVQHIEYDEYGREVKKYLPYTEGSNYGTYRTNALSGQSSFYNNGAANGVVSMPIVGGITPSFAETKFEPSPLNRVEQQGAPGAAWQLSSGHTIKTEYGTNTTSEVQLWSLTSNGATTNGAYYPANSLYKTTIKDENWSSNQIFPQAGISEEFKDKDEQTVLKRTYNVKDNALQTLSTYYIYDDLNNLVYVVPPGASLSSFTEGDAIFNQYIYAYHYDHRNRVIEKKIPAKGWEYMVYNKLDQVVMNQDANQRSHANQDWLVTKYDAHGREVSTGIWVHNGSDANTSYRIDLQSNVDNQSFQWDIRQSGGNGYTNSLSEYRTYPQNVNTTLTLSYYDDYSFPGNSFGGSTAGQSSNVTTLLTGTKTAILGSSTMLLTVSYYDEDGRVIQKKSENHLGGTDIVDNTYSFTDELLTSTRIHTVNGNTTTIADRYEYDHVGRKKKSFQQIGNTEVTLSNSDYNEVGQLKTKELHSANNSAYIHTTQYTYNERGWKRTIAGSKFNLTLAYDTDISPGVIPSFNGNIAEARYTTDHSGTNQIRYEYDKANRLIRSVHAQGVLTEENIKYDLMGNIQYLERGNYGNLTYTYNGNQLSSVSGYLNKTYSDYDANGNMRADGTKQYFYNMLNLPSLIQHQGGGTILTYTYDAERNKLQSTGSTGTWDYLDGIHYQNNQLKFINNEEGRAVYSPSTGTFKYEYALEDHLGNARVYIDESGGQARVIQEDEYYSFGLRRGRYDYASNNRYLYNGKELQDEIGMYDYGARFYDPAIGRWHSVDPRVEEDDEWSPYNYVRNNPVLYNDPDGEIWNVVIGAAIGAAVDYGSQVAGNMVAGKSLSQSLTQVDGRSIAASAVLGGITSGASALGAGGVKATVIVGARALPKVTTAQKVIAKTATTAKRVVEKAKESKSSKYDASITGKNSVRNVKTDVTKKEFGKNLEKSGYSKQVSKDGKATTYSKGDSKYSVRDNQSGKGTQGASADFSKGTQKPTLKIRLDEK